MKALYFDDQLVFRDVDKPQAQPHEALIEVALAGICGTDRQILRGYSGFHGIPGDEFVGRVVECGDASWLGKRVVGEINVTCGSCNWCRRGLGRHCPNRTVMGIAGRSGCFAEFVTLPVANLHQVHDGVPDQAAVFAEPLAAAAEILEQIHISPATPVAVLGDGRLGLLIAQVLCEARARVTVIGRHEEKLALARSWGLEAVRAGAATLSPKSFAVVVDATGSPEGLTEALRLVEPRGTVAMKSTFHGLAQFDTAKLVVDEVTLLGSRCGNVSTALRLLRDASVKVLPLVSKTYPLEAGREAFDDLDRHSCLKVLLAPK